MKSLFLTILALVFTFQTNAQWKKYEVGTDASFRGLDVVSEKVIWASGTGGTVIRTINGGTSWDVFKVKGAENLDFRDIEAFGEDTAYILSIGKGDSSRIYKTEDGGKNWKLQFRSGIEDAFFDSIAFWDEKNGLAQSDPVDGKYVFFQTTDGETWTQLDTSKMPPAKDGEAAFAASGTCIVTEGKERVWLITGGTDARVFLSKNRGRTWRAYDTPMINGAPASGIFGIAMRDSKQGVIVGGNYQKPNEAENNLAVTRNGGKRWKLVEGLNGYRSGVAYVNKNTVVAVGSNGSDISYDRGTTWKRLDGGNYNAVQSMGMKSTWVVGPRGMVARLVLIK